MQKLLKALRVVVPLSFVLGASMEFFMIHTGFYTIVTKKEAERRLERRLDEERQLRRMKELNISVNDNNNRH